MTSPSVERLPARAAALGAPHRIAVWQHDLLPDARGARRTRTWLGLGLGSGLGLDPLPSTLSGGSSSIIRSTTLAHQVSYCKGVSLGLAWLGFGFGFGLGSGSGWARVRV